MTRAIAPRIVHTNGVGLGSSTFAIFQKCSERVSPSFRLNRATNSVTPPTTPRTIQIAVYTTSPPGALVTPEGPLTHQTILSFRQRVQRSRQLGTVIDQGQDLADRTGDDLSDHP
jgi:hypothetical protein